MTMTATAQQAELAAIDAQFKDPAQFTETVQQKYQRDYRDLFNTMKDLGYMRRRYGWYAFRFGLLLAGFAAGVAVLFIVGPSPWQLLNAVWFSFIITQIAFMSHDGAHRQIFESGKANEWASRIVGNLFVGLSYGWWMKKHGAHHAQPNKIGKDGDIKAGAIVFTAQDAQDIHGVRAWFMARQHWYFLPILLLAGADLHVNALKTVLGRAPFKHRVAEASLLAVRLIGFPILVLFALGPWWGLAFLAVQVGFFGLYMAGSFAPNHKGMPVIPESLNVDFLRRQTLLSRNISGGPAVGFLMGGLNYQIEHHLFPSMPSIALRKAQPIVREYCEANGVRYTETTIVGSYRIIINYLKRVGIKHADPFSCPITAQFRTR
jgi:fatty acid desaturase